MYLLGYDIGSSSVKASLVNAETGKCVSSAFFPKTEAAIIAVKPGWAEQNPEPYLHRTCSVHSPLRGTSEWRMYGASTVQIRFKGNPSRDK